MPINIINLSTELLIQIFEYCDIYDLFKLRICCRRFNNVLIHNQQIFKKSAPLVSNQSQPIVIARSKKLLDTLEKWRISHNWCVGRYKLHVYNKKHRKNMPCLQLEKNFVWVTEENIIKSYKRLTNPGNRLIDALEPCNVILSADRHFILTKFVVKDDFVLAGNRDGGILWATRDKYITEELGHTADVTCVDIGQDVLISGAHDSTFVIWRYNRQDVYEYPYILLRKMIGERLWSTKISPSQQYVAIGSMGINVFPLHIYDLECYEPLLPFTSRPFRRGSGILDIHWQDDNTLLTCGFDAYLRKWDVRSGKCVQRWEEPHDSSLYCIATDDLYSVFCGTKLHGKVTLWDQRKPNYVQMYYTCETRDSSPVYSISFDATEMFVTLDRSLRVLDFSKRHGPIKNYREMFASSHIYKY